MHGPEFKFLNKIYHLNVDFINDFGHISINNLTNYINVSKNDNIVKEDKAKISNYNNRLYESNSHKKNQINCRNNSNKEPNLSISITLPSTLQLQKAELSFWNSISAMVLNTNSVWWVE